MRRIEGNLGVVLTLIAASLPAQQAADESTKNPAVASSPAGVTGHFRGFLMSDLQRAQVENIIQRDAACRDISSYEREGGGYRLFAERPDGTKLSYLVTQDNDGDIQVLRGSHDSDFINRELTLPEAKLGTRRNTESKRWEGGPNLSLKAGHVIGDHGAVGWIVSPSGRAWKAEYRGHLLEMQGSIGVDAKGPTAGVSADGPGATIEVGGVSTPFCQDGRLRAHEFSAGVSGGAGLYKIGIDKSGRVTLKVLGIGGTVASEYHLVDLSKLDEATRERLERLCNQGENPQSVASNPELSRVLDEWIRARTGEANTCEQGSDPIFDALARDIPRRAERSEEMSRVEDNQREAQQRWLRQERELENRRIAEREDARRAAERERSAQLLASEARRQGDDLKQAMSAPTPLDAERERWANEFATQRERENAGREARADSLSKETATRWKKRLGEMKERQQAALKAAGAAVGGPMGAAAGEAVGSMAGSSQSEVQSESGPPPQADDQVEVAPPIRIPRADFERGVRVEQRTRIEYGPPPPPPKSPPLPPPPPPTSQGTGAPRVILP